MRFLLFILIVSLTMIGCQTQPQKQPPIPVKSFLVAAQTIPAKFQFVGVAKSSHPVEIRARVEGYLNAIDYVEGSLVQKGALLFELDPRPFQAKLVAAQGALAKQEAILWRAKKSLERITPLYQQNAASERDFDNATAQVLTAEASVIEAKANLVQAELNLSYTYIASPIVGLTGRALFREGTLITPSVNGLLTEVSVIDPIWIDLSVSDDELLVAKAQGGAKSLILPQESEYDISLILADGTQYPYTGKVNFTSPTLNPQTATMTIRAEFVNPNGEILPGQFVRANVSGAYRPNAILVPQESVFQGNHGMYVFVISSDNKVQLRPVETGGWFENYWIIQHGLQPGEHVIAEGTNKVQDGSNISVISTSSYTQTSSKK